MAAGPLLCGVDAGTTRIRALLFTPSGQLVAEGSRPTPVERPRPGWAEHDPEALWQATCGALRDAIAPIAEPARILGLAVASVGEAFVALDRDGRPTCRTIAWYDERPKPELARLEAAIGRARLHALTGLAPDPTFSLCKLLWLKANQPDAIARTRLWLNVAHYLAWRLTGVPGADLTLASRSLALDLERRVWAEELIREVGLEPAIFAPLRPWGARLGEVTAAAAAATGLPTSCAVGVAGHDHIVGALAARALAPGVLFNSMGTAEALTLALERPVAAPEFLARGYNQGVVELDAPVHYVFGGFQTSGACIEWFRALFGAELAHDAADRRGRRGAGRLPRRDLRPRSARPDLAGARPGRARRLVRPRRRQLARDALSRPPRGPGLRGPAHGRRSAGAPRPAPDRGDPGDRRQHPQPAPAADQAPRSTAGRSSPPRCPRRQRSARRCSAASRRRCFRILRARSPGSRPATARSSPSPPGSSATSSTTARSTGPAYGALRPLHHALRALRAP